MPRAKQLVRREESLPAYMQVKNEDLGTDNIESDDIVIPRIKICQALSKVKKVMNINDGEIYNTVSNINYGNGFSFWVLLYWRSRVWFEKLVFQGTIYKDIETGEEIKFGSNLPFCEENYAKGQDSFNYMIITEKELIEAIKTGSIPFPTIMSFMRAALSPAKQLNGKFKTNSLKKPPIPIYGQLIKMATTLKSFGVEEAFMPVFSYDRFPSQDEFQGLKELYKNCKILQRKSAAAEAEEEVDGNTGQKIPKSTPYDK